MDSSPDSAMQSRIECVPSDDSSSIEVLLWLELGFAGQQAVATGVKSELGHQEICRSGIVWLPSTPLDFTLERRLFEQGRWVVLAVGSAGYRPASVAWRDMEWVWQQEYVCELSAVGSPRLREASVSPGTDKNQL